MKITTLDKCKELKRMLNSSSLEFLMECHSGLSAVIAEEVGFKGLWASGLSVSAMTGCRDRNELDLSEVCKIVEWMADHTSVPILVDGDTGGVDWRASQLMVNKLYKAGAAGVCIEDKVYPKHNSFLNNSSNDLADPLTHAGKIKAMKKENPDFVVVARLESFIAGKGLDDAFQRALIYRDAGADAILVHSKIKDSSEIDSFMNRWSAEGNNLPIVIVPTKYYKTPTCHFDEDLGISMVIWANHQMRASIQAMEEVTRRIYNDKSLINIENTIAPVNEIFRLQRDHEMEEEEKKYLPSYNSTALILSAINSKHNVPKSLDKLPDGKKVIDHQINSFKKDGVSKFKVVAGQDYFEFDGVISEDDMIINPCWYDTTEVGSTLSGLSEVSDLTYLSYGDIIFKDNVLRKMSSVDNCDIVISVDPEYDGTRYNEYVLGNTSYSRLNSEDEFKVLGSTTNNESEKICGSFVGLLRINTRKGFKALKKAVEGVFSLSKSLRFVEVLRILSTTCDLKGVYVTSDEWVDISNDSDLQRAVEV